MKQDIIQIKLLPYKYKKAGYWVLLLALPLSFCIGVLLLKSGVVQNERLFFDEWNDLLVYYPIIIGLTFLNFSEERQEDEMVQNLRYKSFMSGVFLLVMGLLWLPFYSNIMHVLRSENLSMPDGGGMLGALMLLLIYTYASFRYNLYRTRKALEADEE